ncbi:hypothetical protein MAFF301560_45960 (plasmid) [Ralstonia solanacearum]|nr:hypothetical protein MAFF301560_45960 [Ralstonia solanacearum]BEU49272.1 hypothetical protein MAFF211519_45970 [Ralstonia pseudosolanacearum]
MRAGMAAGSKRASMGSALASPDGNAGGCTAWDGCVDNMETLLAEMGDKTFQGTRKRAPAPREGAAGARQAAPAARERIVPHIFFHPDSDRRPRHLTGSADPGMRCACRALAGSQTDGPHTAGGEFHPALKTYQAGNGAGSRDATPAARRALPLLTGRTKRPPGGMFRAGAARADRACPTAFRCSSSVHLDVRPASFNAWAAIHVGLQQ